MQPTVSPQPDESPATYAGLLVLAAVCTVASFCLFVASVCTFTLPCTPIFFALIGSGIAVFIVATIASILMVKQGRKGTNAYIERTDYYKNHEKPEPPPRVAEEIAYNADNPGIFLAALSDAQRDSVEDVTINEDEGILHFNITIDDHDYVVNFNHIGDVNSAFPRVKRLHVYANLPNQLTLDGGNGEKFSKLEYIEFFCRGSNDRMTLTFTGRFDALQEIKFNDGRKTISDFTFLGKDLSGLKKLDIAGCTKLRSVHGIWDGDTPMFAHSSFEILDMPAVDSQDLKSYLKSKTVKYLNTFTCNTFTTINGEHEITVNLCVQREPDDRDQHPLRIEDLAIAKEATLMAPNGRIRIPCRKHTQSSLKVKLQLCGYADVTNNCILNFQRAANTTVGTAATSMNDISNPSLHVSVGFPIELLTIGSKPSEAVDIELTKKNSSLVVQFLSNEEVPEEVLLDIKSSAEDAAAPGGPCNFKIFIGMVEIPVVLLAKDGVGHLVAMAESRAIVNGWRKFGDRPGEAASGLREGRVVIRRNNLVPAT
jgi:hypothetical protein